jgi:lipoyl(octanoyl) transferase
VIEYVRRIEEVLIRTCGDFGIPAGRVAGLTGVWTSPEPGDSERAPEQAKIAAIGVHISRAVTSHGFALNVNTDLGFFDLIIPCGIESKPVTSMAKELGGLVPLESVAHSVSRNVGTVFESQILWLDNLDALLGETVGVPMRPPKELRRLRGEDDPAWA